MKADKISDSDRKVILDKCQDIIHWLDGNQLAEKEEFDHKLKEAESVCNPIITKLYQSAGGAPGGFPGGPGGAHGESHGAAGGRPGGPTIEEVD
uniref:Heat shock protein 70 n=1 Tax=Romanomermis culicivorax TaxID=13658 RepID=A0A915JBI1_ROMCU